MSRQSPPSHTDSRRADVCLILEGTYPYVFGGVSSWADQIIRGLPDFRFSLVYLGSQKAPGQKPVFELPPNVVSLTEIFLHDRLPEHELKPGRPSSRLRNEVYRALRSFYLSDSPAGQIDQFWRLADHLEKAERTFTFGNLCADFESWEVLGEVYEKFAPHESFIDFFWMARSFHLPLWKIWRARQEVPEAGLYHSLSTGYAGLLGALAARRFGAPYLLTEHGIYTKERIAEISEAEWIYEQQTEAIDFSEGLGKLKQMWINLFIFLGRLTYESADQIITLFEGNTYTQIEFGARSEKLRIIPNGIDPAKFDGIRQQHEERWRTPPATKTVGFIGRIVRIKDVKTLIRAARLVCEKVPQVQFLVAGPTAEDPNYFDECQKIVKLLQIEPQVHFLGMQKLMEVLPKMDVLVLTSISEGLPLVMLEAMAAGLPVVATDVGACRELIFGTSPADKALGRAGGLTKILSPSETANALIKLLLNPDLVRSMGAAGRKRVESFYSMHSVLQSYSELYRNPRCDRRSHQPLEKEESTPCMTP